MHTCLYFRCFQDSEGCIQRGWGDKCEGGICEDFLMSTGFHFPGGLSLNVAQTIFFGKVVAVLWSKHLEEQLKQWEYI